MTLTSRQTPRFDPDQLLTVSAFCELTGISEQMAYRRIRLGEIPAVKVGRTVRVPRRVVRGWIEEAIRGNRNGG
jgi:excisionase family DNA binding protein